MSEEIFNFLKDHVVIISIVIVILLGLIILWRYIRHRHKTGKTNQIKQEFFEDDSYLYENSEPLATVETIDESTIPSLEQVVTEEEIAKEQISKSTEPAELIIALFVVAQNEQGFTGSDIFAVLEEQGLNYGKMRIFHHYGIGEVKTKSPVFSIANMLEPGIFNPKEMDNFASPGLALFMRLPGPFGGRVAFELMLNKAQRIAEILEGKVVDEQHQELTQHTINSLREHIAYFEER